MKRANVRIGIVLTSNDPETAWNALRYACFAQQTEKQVRVFLLGQGVEVESIDTEHFSVSEELRRFIGLGGAVFACGTCMKSREIAATAACPVSTLSDLHAIVAESDRVLTF